MRFPFFNSNSASDQSINVIGNVYSFKTKPYTDFSEADTKRYAALKVLDVFEDGRICALVMGGGFEHPISTRDLKRLRPLVAKRFGFKGEPCVVTQPSEKQHTLDEFTFVAHKKLSSEERAAINPNIYGSWGFASAHAEGEWRWEHDRDKLMAEVARRDEFEESKRAKIEAKHQYRLRELNWDDFLNSPAIETWCGDDRGGLPIEFVTEVSAAFRNYSQELRGLGVKPSRGSVRRLIRELVYVINSLNAEYSGVIETFHREALVEILTDLIYLSRQKALVDELEEWREW